METSFISRWSKRKLANENNSENEEATNDVASEERVLANVTDEQHAETTNTDTSHELNSDAETADVNDEDSAQQETSVAALLTSEAEAAVKKAALRKLFLSGEFSDVDRLNDYDHDYKSVKSLSSEAAAKLRDWMNQSDEDDKEEELAQGEVQAEDGAAQDQESPAEETDTADEVRQNIPHQK